MTLSCAVTYGSEDRQWRSATGRFIARWKVNLRVNPGGALGIGVLSKPPAGFEDDDADELGAEDGLPSAAVAAGAAAGASGAAAGSRIFSAALSFSKELFRCFVVVLLGDDRR